MKSSKIYTGAEAYSKKDGHGIITRVITKSTGYVEVRYDNGTTRKEMAFNLTDNNGESLKAAPKRHASEPAKADTVQEMKYTLLRVNNRDEREANEATAYLLDKLCKKAQGNEFIDSLMNAWFDVKVGARRGFSEKQAYYLAKFVVDE